MKATGWLCASVLLIGLLTHLNSLGGSFHYDDAHSIVEPIWGWRTNGLAASIWRCAHTSAR
jgi:hypothetical protein